MNNGDRFENFPLCWRFTDPNYNLVSDRDLMRIVPIDREHARRLWQTSVSDWHDHITAFPSQYFAGCHRITLDWNAKANGQQRLVEEVHLGADVKVLFFWSKSCAVQTDWAIVVRYWDDFCYPDDDNSVIVEPINAHRIFYSEEVLFVPPELQCSDPTSK